MYRGAAVAPFHYPRTQFLAKDVDRAWPSEVEMATTVMVLGQTGRHRCMTRKAS